VNGVVTKIKGSRRASAITVALGVLLVAAAAWLGVVSPKRSHASQLKTDVTSAQTQLASATAEAATANKEAAAAAVEALPATADQPGILDQLNKLGKKTGVMIATVTPSATTTLTNAVPLSVIVNGNYFQVRNFLKRLRTQVRVGTGGRVVASGRLFDVQSVNIAQGTNGGQLSATIAVNAYMYTPSVATPPTASTTATAAAATTGSTG
jgi:Tfp pilus assembly protein PilO